MGNIGKRLRVTLTYAGTMGIGGCRGIAVNDRLTIEVKKGKFYRVKPRDCSGIR